MMAVGLGAGVSAPHRHRHPRLQHASELPLAFQHIAGRPPQRLATHPPRWPVTCFAPTLPPLPSYSTGDAASSTPALKPLPRAVENVADDPSLHNPKQRLERMSTGWMGVIMEYEGVVVDDTSSLHTDAWLQLGTEESKPRPLQWAVRRAQGMKTEQVIQEVFCWTRNPTEVRRLAARHEEIYRGLLGERKPMVPPGVRNLLDILAKHNVPVALACSAPETRVKAALRDIELAGSFDAVITAEDVYRGRPDPESYVLAAQQLGRPPVRCVVIGNSNQSVEAARECGMQCVVVAGRNPIYELTAADLVVRQLEDLTFVNLKQLFRNEQGVEPQPQEEEEVQAQPKVQTQTLTMDY